MDKIEDMLLLSFVIFIIVFGKPPDKHLLSWSPFNNYKVPVTVYAHVGCGVFSASVISWIDESHCAWDKGSLCQKQVECFGFAACIQGDDKAFQIQYNCCPAGQARVYSSFLEYGSKFKRTPTTLETGAAVVNFLWMFVADIHISLR